MKTLTFGACHSYVRSSLATVLKTVSVVGVELTVGQTVFSAGAPYIAYQIAQIHSAWCHVGDVLDKTENAWTLFLVADRVNCYKRMWKFKSRSSQALNMVCRSKVTLKVLYIRVALVWTPCIKIWKNYPASQAWPLPQVFTASFVASRIFCRPTWLITNKYFWLLFLNEKCPLFKKAFTQKDMVMVRSRLFSAHLQCFGGVTEPELSANHRCFIQTPVTPADAPPRASDVDRYSSNRAVITIQQFYLKKLQNAKV